MLHYISLQTVWSGLSKSNFKDHYGEAVKQQCLDMICLLYTSDAADE